MDIFEFKNQVKRMCKYYTSCDGCPFWDEEYKEVNGFCVNQFDITKATEEDINAVIKWAEDHPIKRNRDKFKEIFGKTIVASHDKPGYYYITGNITDEIEASAWLNKEYIEEENKK